METNRQKKIASVLQNDIVNILQSDAQNSMPGVILSVTKVSVTSDLSIAKVYLSIFPNDKRDFILKGIRDNTLKIKNQVAFKTKHQLRKMPNLIFYVDDSLDYIESINKALKGEENPITNPEILQRRKKF